MNAQDHTDLPVSYGTFIKAIILAFIVPLAVFLPVPLLSTTLVIAGGGWCAWGGWIIYRSVASKKWKVVQGSIVENQVGRIVVPSVPGWRTDSFPIIGYRYCVNGVEYISWKIVLFASDLQVCDDPAYKPPYKLTEDFCAKYPLNSIVSVHHNPRSPKDAVLMVGALSRSKQHSIVFIILGSFLFLLGVFLFYVQL